MRILEIILVAIEGIVIVVSFARKETWTTWMKALVVLAVALGMMLLCTEGYRWQMYPACLVGAIFAAYLAGYLAIGSAHSERSPALLNWAAMLLLISAVVLGSVLPIFSLPTPDGPFAIGTISDTWFRPVISRDIAQGWVGSRKIIVQLWYPTAAGQEGKIAPYRGSDSGWLLTHYLRLVRTHAQIGVPVSPAQSSYPVLLFSPAWDGGRTDYTAFYETLASHGYVIAAMEHVKDLDGPFLGMNLEQYREAGALVRRRAEDAVYVLDQLTKRNERGPDERLTGRRDLSRVGILGHSFGGAAAADTCWLDRRFKAGIDVGGVLYGEVAAAGTSQPVFFILTDTG